MMTRHVWGTLPDIDRNEHLQYFMMEIGSTSCILYHRANKAACESHWKAAEEMVIKPLFNNQAYVPPHTLIGIHIDFIFTDRRSSAHTVHKSQ